MSLIEQIKYELKQQDALLLAHYYVSSELQELADKTGGIVSDSLEMARFGKNSDAKILIIAGVRFMAETAKILSPQKKILAIDENATCSLDLSCPIKEFSQFCQQYPDREIVVYANTSADIKAMADWVVTSGSALKVVEHLHCLGKKIIWAPDKHLGSYVQRKSNADMIIWDGSCVVHEGFKADLLLNLKRFHPDACVLVHPESPKEVVDLADVVGSTTELIKAVANRKENKFIVATDNGIFHKMREIAPDKKLIEAPNAGVGATCESCAHCDWMAMNDLEKCLQVLKTHKYTINIDLNTILMAQKSINKLLNFTQNNNNQLNKIKSQVNH